MELKKKKEELFSWGSVSLLPESHDVSNHDEPALSASMDHSLSHHQLFLYGPEPQPSAALSASMDRNLSHQQLLASPSLWFCQLLYHIEENLTNSRSRLLCQLSNNGSSLLFSVCEHPQSIIGTQRTAFLTPQTRAGTYGLPVFSSGSLWKQR